MKRAEKMQLARALATATQPETIRPSRTRGGRGTSTERSSGTTGDRGQAPSEEQSASPAPRTCEPCQVLSTEMHRYCRGHGCICPCRLRSSAPSDRPKRPHSYPRPDWRRRLPAGTTRRREEKQW